MDTHFGLKYVYRGKLWPKVSTLNVTKCSSARAETYIVPIIGWYLAFSKCKQTHNLDFVRITNNCGRIISLNTEWPTLKVWLTTKDTLRTHCKDQKQKNIFWPKFGQWLVSLLWFVKHTQFTFHNLYVFFFYITQLFSLALDMLIKSTNKI